MQEPQQPSAGLLSLQGSPGREPKESDTEGSEAGFPSVHFPVHAQGNSAGAPLEHVQGLQALWRLTEHSSRQNE